MGSKKSKIMEVPMEHRKQIRRKAVWAAGKVFGLCLFAATLFLSGKLSAEAAINTQSTIIRENQNYTMRTDTGTWNSWVNWYASMGYTYVSATQATDVVANCEGWWMNLTKGGKNYWAFLHRDTSQADSYAGAYYGWWQVSTPGDPAPGGCWYYTDEHGIVRTDTWLYVKAHNNTPAQLGYFYVDAAGRLLSGWQSDGSNTYYLGYEGAYTGWHGINGSYYYFEADGIMARNTWRGEYYLDGNGIRQNRYFVSYNANGGSGSVATQTVAYNQRFNINQNLFARKGYTFSRWTSGSSIYNPGQEVVNLTGSHNATVTLYAAWTANTYKVSFHANGGSVSTTAKNVIYDAAYGTLPVPTRVGYSFQGWYTAASGGTQCTAATRVTAAGAHTLYAHWGKNSYTVTYHANGGASVSKSAATAVYGSAVDLSVTAQKDGYIFAGWNTSPTAKEGFSDYAMPAGNVTLYAIYSIPVSDVKEVYVQAWNTGNHADYRTYPMTRTAADKLDYTYELGMMDISQGLRDVALSWSVIAWDYAGNYRILKETEPSPIPQQFLQTVEHFRYDRVLADWVRFDTTSELKLKGEEYTPQYIQMPEGYEADHIDPAYIVEQDTNSGAYYKPIGYTLYFDPNGGSCSMASKDIFYGDMYGELPTAEWYGHTFLGWFTDPEGGSKTVSSARYETAQDSTLYAQWQLHSHRVVYDFHTNGGNWAETEYAEVSFGESINLGVAAQKEGWVHMGWSTSPDATTALESLTMEDEDVVLYAIYRKDITATYVDKNDTETVIRAELLSLYNRAAGGMVTVPAQSSLSGWQKEGYSLGEEGDADVDAAEGMEVYLTEDTTFYGRYTTEVTVSYDTAGSGQEILPETKTRHYNASGQYVNGEFTIKEAAKRSRYSFAGWQDAQQNSYTPGQEVEFASNTLLIAIWDKFPEVEAYDRYFTLQEAQSGAVTRDVLLEKVIGTDLEDGILSNGRDVVVVYYQPQDFTGFLTDGSVSVTYRATDSFGNVTEKRVMAHIVDTTLRENPQQEYVRFISPRFYKSGEDYVSANRGGLEEFSLWKINPVYAASLDYAMANEKTGTVLAEITVFGKDYAIEKPGTGTWEHKVETWNFTRKQIQEVEEFVTEQGFGNYKDSDGIDRFYEIFGDCRS